MRNPLIVTFAAVPNGVEFCSAEGRTYIKCALGPSYVVGVRPSHIANAHIPDEEFGERFLKDWEQDYADDDGEQPMVIRTFGPTELVISGPIAGGYNERTRFHAEGE